MWIWAVPVSGNPGSLITADGTVRTAAAVRTGPRRGSAPSGVLAHEDAAGPAYAGAAGTGLGGRDGGASSATPGTSARLAGRSSGTGGGVPPNAGQIAWCAHHS